jgi:hypothetical protein
MGAVFRKPAGNRIYENAPIRADMKNSPRNLFTFSAFMDTLPDNKSNIPCLVSIDQTWGNCTNVGASADHQQDDQKQRLKVEKR